MATTDKITMNLERYEEIMNRINVEKEKTDTYRALLESKLDSNDAILVYLGDDVCYDLGRISGLYTTNEVIKSLSRKKRLIENSNLLQIIWHKYITKKL
jgi:hypothetical protein